MEFWKASSAQLYRSMLVLAVGRLVILVNTSQSILNFQNCCVVISKMSWGSFVVGGFMWLTDDIEGSMVSTSPMPSSLSIVWSSMWRLFLVISSLENVCTYILAEVADMPASTNMLSHPAKSYPTRSTMSKFGTWVLNYMWKRIVTWASGREDYMHIRAFHHVQVVSSIPSVLIGCEPRSSYASVNICWLTHWHLFVSRRQPGCRAGKHYFLLCIRAVASSVLHPQIGFLIAILSYRLASKSLLLTLDVDTFFYDIGSVLQWCLEQSAFCHISWWNCPLLLLHLVYQYYLFCPVSWWLLTV